MPIKTQLNFLAMLEEIYFDEIMVKKEREIFINYLCIINYFGFISFIKNEMHKL